MSVGQSVLHALQDPNARLFLHLRSFLAVAHHPSTFIVFSFQSSAHYLLALSGPLTIALFIP